MAHQIIAAIIEDGKIKHLDGQLPQGKVKVQLIYDQEEEPMDRKDIMIILKETAGIDQEIDAQSEAKSLRKSWERKIRRKHLGETEPSLYR